MSFSVTLMSMMKLCNIQTIIKTALFYRSSASGVWQLPGSVGEQGGLVEVTPPIRAENGPVCGYRIVNTHKGKIPFEVSFPCFSSSYLTPSSWYSPFLLPPPGVHGGPVPGHGPAAGPAPTGLWGEELLHCHHSSSVLLWTALTEVILLYTLISAQLLKVS